MLISHRYAFIYTKTGKAAGTSVEAYFERFCMPDGAWQPSHWRQMYEGDSGVVGYRGEHPEGRKWYNHMPARDIKRLVGNRVWERYFKFCTVRNPWEKAISAFEFLGRAHRLPSGDEGTAYRNAFPSHDPEQLRFLHWLETVGVPRDRAAYVIDNEICVDDFIRFESLHGDLQRICARLGVDWDPSLLANYKTGTRRPEMTVSRLYRDPARLRVQEACAFEIARFGYQFPG